MIKNVYFYVLNDIIKNCNNTYHKTIKMKSINVNTNYCAEYHVDANKKDPDPKFQVCDRIRISKWKNVFPKGYTPNWSEDVFVIRKIKNIFPGTYVINNLNGEEIVGTFYEKELQKTFQEKFRIGKVIKRKRNKLNVKWKGYANSFNSWIDKRDIVKWIYKKWFNSFLNQWSTLEETLMLKLIYLVAKQILIQEWNRSWYV